MPKFDKDSFSKLSSCHIDLQTLFYEVIKHRECIVIEGYRNQEEQEKAFEENRSLFKWPDSKHNYQPAMAVDVTPIALNSDDDSIFYLFAGFVLGIAQKLKDDGKMEHSVHYGNGVVLHKGSEVFKRNLVHFELVV